MVDKRTHFLVMAVLLISGTLNLSTQETSPSPQPSASPEASITPIPDTSPVPEETTDPFWDQLNPEDTATSSSSDFYDNVFEDTNILSQSADKKNHLEQFLVSDSSKILSGSFSVVGGIGFGWTDWPNPENIAENFDPNAGVSLTPSLAVSFRPADYINGYLGISVPYLGSLTVSSAYLDYTIDNSVFIRMGSSIPGWGYSRIYGNANILTRNSPVSPFTVKIDIPIEKHLVSLIALAGSNYWVEENDYAMSPWQMQYGLRTSFILGPVEWGSGLAYQNKSGLYVFNSLKTSLAGIDLYSDQTIAYPDKDAMLISDFFKYPTISAGFFYEFKDPKIQIGGEYLYNGERRVAAAYDTTMTTGNNITYALPMGGHNSLIRARWKSIGGSGVDLITEWKHNYSDETGSFSIGASFSPLPLVTLVAGIPIYYGKKDGEVVNSDLVGRRISLTIGFKLDAAF